MTVVEKGFVGGACLNWGCIPSKTLLSIGKKLRDMKELSVTPPTRAALWAEMRKRKDQVIRQLRSDDEKSISLSGAELLSGEARFTSPKSLTVSTKSGERKIDFDKAIIAAGSAPIFPPPLDARKKDILDSDRIFDIETLPSSVAIVGGGAVGCEFACLLHELGVKITLIEKTAGLLPGEDAQIANALRKSFEKRGIQVKDSVTAEMLDGKAGAWKITLSDRSTLEAAQILACVGRRPLGESLGLDKASVKISPKGIPVDSKMRTSNPDIFACGDITGLSLLAHAGSAQGEVAAANALGESKEYDGSLVPRCLYTWPEVASIGTAAGKAKRFFFAASGRALAEGDSEGFIQIVLEEGSEKILGGQIIGPHATELIHVLAVAIKAGMASKDLREVIFAHPTFSEGIKGALER
ncbi:MAG: hypothetical protein A3A86_08315 [Elusimicrobia bacterium RIFCSPLOWO2_01_FULL_60_11]|nr:MAG: hypothetical protein A3A86_08315 [Elusimicrobia bacterium RIFCSPLOWO2_01_FULL_60_11]